MHKDGKLWVSVASPVVHRTIEQLSLTKPNTTTARPRDVAGGRRHLNSESFRPDLSAGVARRALQFAFYDWSREMPRWKRQGDVVIGMEEDGSEIVRVPLREPVQVRSKLDVKLRVVRTNCP